MKSLFVKKIRSLNVNVYENGNLMDLHSYNDFQLSELRHAIYPLVQTSPSSAVGYDVEVYDCASFWWKPKKTCIEVLCYLKDHNSISGKRSNSIPRLFAEKMCGKRFTIQPNNGAFRKWADKVEVTFSI